MSIKYYCDKCKKEINQKDSAPRTIYDMSGLEWWDASLIDGDTIHLCAPCLNEFNAVNIKILKIQKKWLDSGYPEEDLKGK